MIFLPGDPRQQDARGWMIAVPYGVYDYVYDPVTTHSVIARIQIPATLGDIPHEIVKESQERLRFAKDVVDSIRSTRTRVIQRIKKAQKRKRKIHRSQVCGVLAHQDGLHRERELVKEPIKTWMM